MRVLTWDRALSVTYTIQICIYCDDSLFIKFFLHRVRSYVLFVFTYIDTKYANYELTSSYRDYCFVSEKTV